MSPPPLEAVLAEPDVASFPNDVVGPGSPVPERLSGGRAEDLYIVPMGEKIKIRQFCFKWTAQFVKEVICLIDHSIVLLGLADCNICFLTPKNQIEIQMYLFGINGLTGGSRRFFALT